jgi:hypothetical protein
VPCSFQALFSQVWLLERVLVEWTEAIDAALKVG